MIVCWNDPYCVCDYITGSDTFINELLNNFNASLILQFELSSLFHLIDMCLKPSIGCYPQFILAVDVK